MNKQRKTSHILNVFQYDADGHVVLPASLTLTVPPAGNDNSAKVTTTAWVRTYVSGLSYITGNQSITVSGDATGSGTTSIALTLANTAVTPGSYGSTTLVPVVTVDSKGRITSVTTAAISGSLTFTGDVTGTGTTGTSTGLTLAASGVTAGTYTKVTVDSKGRVTVGASATTSDISEGTNLYYTDARVLSYLSANTYATQSYVNTQVSNLVASAPATLDTLNELAAALGNDPSFATTVSTSIGTKVPQTRTLTINGTGYDLSADRSWTINSMVYPGAGIALSTGTAWGTSITDNSANWNTAYGWGNHASGGYLTGITSSQVTTALGYTPYNSTNPSGYITSSSSISGNAGSVTYLMNRTDSSAYPVLWGANYTNSIGTIAYSCAAVTIQSSTGTLTATTFSGALSGNATTASSISGFNNPTTAATANTIVYRDTGGDIYGRYILGSYHNSSDNVDTGTITYIMAKFGDNYHRSATAAKVQSFLGLGSLAYSSATIPTNNNQLTNGAGYLTSHQSLSGYLPLSGGTVTGDTTFSSGYYEFGNGVGSVSNDGGWNGRLNVAGSSHARLDVKSVSDGIITTMYSHTGYGNGRVGTFSNHPLGLMVNGVVVGTLSTSGLSIIGTLTATGTITGSNLSGTNTGDQTNISGNAATVTVNSGNTSAGWYPITWHSGNTVYSSSGVEIYAAGNYIRAQYINTTDSLESGITRFVIKNGDEYHRSATTTTAADIIRGVASGTWGISISGNAATATSATSAGSIQTGNNQWIWANGAHTVTSPNTITLWDQYSSLGGSGNLTSYGTILDIHGRGAHEHDQLYFDSSGTIYHRNCFYGTNSWNGWKTMIDSSNIGSQSVNYATTAGNADTVDGFHAAAFPYRSGGSSGYYQVVDWMQFTTSAGIYWPSYNGAHIYPNTTGSHTQLRFDGIRGGYTGVYLGDSAVNGMMYDTAGNGGVYREANSRWYWYHHLGNNCTGIATSTTSSSYRAYIGGALYAEGDIVAYSDVRKKTDIITIDNALNKVINLRGVYYTRIDDPQRGRQTGVIAQEINEVLPEVVTYASDLDEYGVSYGNIVGVLIEAIKEQQTQIEELKNKLDNVLSSR